MFIGNDPISPTNIIAGCVGEYKNIWDLNKINKYIDNVEDIIKDQNSEIAFKKAATFDEMNGIENNTTNRTNYEICLTQESFKSQELKEINNDFYLTLNSAVNNFQQNFGIEDSLYFIEPFNLLRYQGGQHYDAHYDGSTAERRSVSAILYLNDNYEGGELEFVNYNVKIKPSYGSMYLFPSNWAYRHIAHPVTSGTKYAIVTWLHDRQQ